MAKERLNKKYIKFFMIFTFTLIFGLLKINASYAAPSNWALSDVTSAINEGLVPEELQKNYQTKITREQFCALAVKMFEAYSSSNINDILANNNVNANEKPFKDTNSKNVLAVYKFGIVNGIGSSLFAPNKNITRQEAAKILKLLTDIFGKLEEKELIDFVDKADINNWAKEYVDYVVLTQIMNGVKQGPNIYFKPKDNYTIEQAIVTTKRLYDKITICDKTLIGKIDNFVTNRLEGLDNKLKLYNYNYDKDKEYLNYVDCQITINDYEFKVKIGNAELNVIGKYDMLCAIELDGNALENELYLKYYDTNDKEYIKILKYQSDHFDTLLTLVNIEYFGEEVKADGNGKIFGVFHTFNDGTINGYYDINRDYNLERVINKNIAGSAIIKSSMLGAKAIYQNREINITEELIDKLKLNIGDKIEIKDIYKEKNLVTIVNSLGEELKVVVTK